MASVPEFSYQPLVEERNEVRVLSFSKSDDLAATTPASSEHIGLVRCTLEHVSLDERLDDYDQFVVKTPPMSRRSSYDLWHTETNDRYSSHSPPGRANTPPDRTSAHPRYHRFSWGDYGALSYTWGDQSQKRPILLNGTLFFVGRNLETALRRFVHHPDYSDGLKLWVDAISINQADLKERSRQVRRMGEIFGRALLVTIWLGELSETDDDAASLVELQRIVSHCVDDASTKQAVDRTLQDPLLSSALRAAVERLANVTYWTRTWIIQEKCLGPFNASLLFGPYVFSLIPLRNFLTRANNIAGAIKSRERVWQILKLMELAVRHQERQPRDSSDAERKRADMEELALLLMLGRLAHEKDPRDKVYGLMGMVPDYVTRHLEPDYAAPVEHVYADFGRALIHGFGNLDMVLTGNMHPNFAVPSWVADLTDRWDPYLWATDCTAAPSLRLEFSVSQDGRTLTTKAFLCDAIAGTAPHLGYANGALSVLQPARQPSIAPPPGADLKTAIVRTLHRHATLDCRGASTVLDIPWLDALPGAGPTTPGHEARVGEMRARGWAPVLNHANFVDLQQFRALLDAEYAPWRGCRFREFFPADVPVCGDPEGFVRALERHQGIVYPVVTTERGRFGACMHPVEVGDVVAVVPGCYAPVVLRRVEREGNEWRAVSHCFVEGLVRGEGVEGRLVELRIV